MSKTNRTVDEKIIINNEKLGKLISRRDKIIAEIRLLEKENQNLEMTKYNAIIKNMKNSGVTPEEVLLFIENKKK